MKMIVVLLAASIVGKPIEPPPSAPIPPCRLKIGVGIGCAGQLEAATANSVDFYAAYGMNKARLLAPETQAYLSRFLCFRVIETGGPIGLQQHGAVSIATPQGIVKTRWMQVRTAGGHSRNFWMADPYIASKCPAWN